MTEVMNLLAADIFTHDFQSGFADRGGKIFVLPDELALLFDIIPMGRFAFYLVNYGTQRLLRLQFNQTMDMVSPSADCIDIDAILMGYLINVLE